MRNKALNRSMSEAVTKSFPTVNSDRDSNVDTVVVKRSIDTYMTYLIHLIVE